MARLNKAQKLILKWWRDNGRQQLPWHHPRSPYRIWVSEVMLQQTQVQTVLPYFERFMVRFPTLKSLALAQEDEVLHVWTGLGYYSRARNLHSAARVLYEERSGQWPESIEDWEALPGIGRSTAGAIVSASFDLPAPILDGNVKRVLARLHGVEGWPGASAVAKKLWQYAEQWTPNAHAAEWTQAVMDMGALVCKRSKPECDHCPLQRECVAYRNQSTSRIPASRPRKERPIKHLHFLLALSDEGVWLEQRDDSGIWANLWTPPLLDSWPQSRFRGQQLVVEQSLPSFSHQLSHFQLVIHFHIVDMAEFSLVSLQSGVWYSGSAAQAIGLPAPIKKMVQRLWDRAELNKVCC